MVSGENIAHIWSRAAETQHKAFMAEALLEARKAAAMGEVPVGAVLTLGEKIIARGYNRKETSADPTLHGEIVAITGAARVLNAWRLAGTTLYVTLEPCLMCMGALIAARVPGLVFGAMDPKAGACGSLFDLSNDTRLNHSIDVIGGICEAESRRLLQDFFKELRKR
ncbi:MAG: tRNA adenosine(34) deaminase TadA [Thermodesulfobacteriota bacterium]